MAKYWLFFVCIACFVRSLWSQEAETTDSIDFKTKIIALPILFFSPETNLGFGAASMFTFKTDKSNKSLRPSQINVGGAYTLENQILSYASFDVWAKNNDIVIDGEIGYYRFFYYFWGIGEEPRVQEQFSVNFPRLRFEGYHRIKDDFYGGLKLTFDAFDITQRETGGRLENDLYYPGANGGKIAGAGIGLKYDTRNHNFYPTKGYNVYLSYERFDKGIGSDFNYHLLWLNAIRYFDLKKDRVIAANIYGRFTNGEVPFFHLSGVGGNSRMRGYYEGFHRDKQLVGWQVEYRSPLFWRIGFVAFAGNAIVGASITQLKIKNIKTTAGLGLRFKLDKERKINLRADYGMSKETNGFYFTIGEAF